MATSTLNLTNPTLKSVTLELSPEEAGLLLGILSACNGKGTTPIYNALKKDMIKRVGYTRRLPLINLSKLEKEYES